MPNKFLNWLEKHGRYRVIYDRSNDEPYLIRYYLLFKDRPRWFPFNVVLHKICKSDIPILHDHPWPWATIILKGGYMEHVPGDGDWYLPVKKCWRGAGNFRFRRSKDLHWLELVNGNPCWTLFFMGKRCRDWGFLKDGEWIESEKFLAQQ